MPAGFQDIGKLVATLGLNTAPFVGGINEANGAMRRFGAGAMIIGRSMTRFVTLPMAIAGGAAVKMQKDFEYSMQKIEGLVGVASEQVQEWNSQVLDMSRSVGRGPTELADALFFITSAGIRGAESMEVLEMAAKASAAGMGETKVVADLVTSAMNAFGKENLSAAEATDILTATVREGKAEADSLAQAMGFVLPVAAEMGLSFDQVGASFAAMTRTGTNAATAATQLKAILTKTLNPSVEAEKALRDMGTSAGELRRIIREDGLIEALKFLRQLTNQFGEDAIAKVYPNIRALLGVLDIMGANAEENVGIFKRLSNSTGSLNSAFLAIKDTTQFKLDTAVSNLQATFVQFGEALKGPVSSILETVAGKLAGIAQKFEALNDAQKKVVVTLAALTAGFGPALLVISRFTQIILANPVLALAAAIAAVTTALLGFHRVASLATEGLSEQERIAARVNDAYDTQAAKVEYLVGIIEDENISNRERIKAIEKLKEILPEYNGTLSKEGELIRHNTEAIEEYLEALRKRIKVEVFKDEYIKLLQKQVAAERELKEAQKGQDAALKSHLEITKELGWERLSAMEKELAMQSEEARALGQSTTLVAEKIKAYAAVREEIKQLRQEMQDMGIDFGFLDDAGEQDDGGLLDSIYDTSVVPEVLGAIGLVEAELDRLLAMKGMIAEEDLAAYNDRVAQLQDEKARLEALTNQHERQLGFYGRMKEIVANLRKEQEYAGFMEYWMLETLIQQYLKKIDAMKGTEEEIFSIKDAFNEMADTGRKAAAAIVDIGTAIGESFAGSSKAWQNLVTNVLSGARQIIQALLAVAISKMIEGEMVKGLPGLITAAIGVAALTAFWKSKVPEFASGALLYGDTLFRGGEYPGARNNPEVVAPLNKLQALMQPTGGMFPETIEFKMKGEDVYAVVQLQQKLKSTY
jgi:TP901 family phage tail tape measure protein